MYYPGCLPDRFGPDHKPDPQPEVPPEKPCQQIKRKREYDKLMKKSHDQLVVMCATVSWSLYMSIPWLDKLARPAPASAFALALGDRVERTGAP